MGALWGEIWLCNFTLQRTGLGAMTDGGHILASFTLETLKLSGGLGPLQMLSG